MPSREVNGARLFVRTWGGPPRTPVLLIHGALADGPTDWKAIAPVLALSRRVIVPDCRGHGRSTNPGGRYAFSEMAADLAALVRAGPGRAHVVGHSNGGNVALAMAVEQPDVLASVVVQAGNAYVSEDLAAAAPRIFDPDRVDRENPAWRDLLVRLHDRFQGRGAWRHLLELTGREVAIAPNYTPADLAAIAAATLVIEGQDDSLNAASGHGAFIARHVPDAELWRPDGVGHTVHEEAPGAWLTCVTEFWDRRGTPTRDALWRLGRARFRDRRTAVFEVELPATEAEAPAVTVLGIDVASVAAGVPGDVRLIPLAARGPAIVRAGVADVLAEPTDDAERLTQLLYGERVERYELAGRYRRVRTVADGYLGWTRDSALDSSPGKPATHRITADDVAAVDRGRGSTALRLAFGAWVTRVGAHDGWIEIAGPNASTLSVPEGTARPVDESLTIRAALERFEALVGIPYLWGGRSPWGFDCSGLAQRFHDELGISIPRDADQQWQAGTPVDPPARPGDLLFFSDPGDAEAAIRHVGIALDRSRMLHAWGAAGAVVVTDSDRPWDDRERGLSAAFRGARRFTGEAQRG